MRDSSIKDSAFEELLALKKVLDPEGKAIYAGESSDVIYREAEQDEIEKDLIGQYKKQEAESEEDLDFLDDFNGPQQDEKVEIEYYDGVVKSFVNISFEKFTGKLTNDEYFEIHSLLQQVARSKSSEQRQEMLKEIETYGEDAVEVAFRESRQFDLVNEKVLQEIVQMISRLSYRSLKSRLLIKGILEHSTSFSHLRMAILVSGILREREVIQSLHKLVYKEDYFLLSFEALVRIRDIKSVSALIQAINALDPARKDLIDGAVTLSGQFKNFGTPAVQPIFEAYSTCKTGAIRPIYIKGFRSFGEDAVPVLAESLYSEKDEKRYMQICMTLGGLKTVSANSILTTALINATDAQQKKAIIRGFGYSGMSSSTDLLLKELDMNSEYAVKEECINALSYVASGNPRAMKAIERHVDSKQFSIKLAAMSCLLRSGDSKYYGMIEGLLLRNDPNQQRQLEIIVSRLPLKELTKLVEKMEFTDDEKTIRILSVLQRIHQLPRNTGAVLSRKLQQNLPQYVDIEIYRLIAKHANTRNELLPIKVLYNARDQSESDRLKRELTTMIHSRGIQEKDEGRIIQKM